MGAHAYGQPKCHRGGGTQARLVFGTSYGDGAEEADAEALDPAGAADAAEDAAVGILPSEVAEVPRVLADLKQHGDGERVVVGGSGALGVVRERAAVIRGPLRELGEVLGARDGAQARVRRDQAVPEARQVGHAVPQRREMGVADELAAQV